MKNLVSITDMTSSIIRTILAIVVQRIVVGIFWPSNIGDLYSVKQLHKDCSDAPVGHDTCESTLAVASMWHEICPSVARKRPQELCLVALSMSILDLASLGDAPSTQEGGYRG